MFVVILLRAIAFTIFTAIAIIVITTKSCYYGLRYCCCVGCYVFTSIAHIQRKDERLYSENGILQMLSRNMGVRC